MVFEGFSQDYTNIPLDKFRIKPIKKIFENKVQANSHIVNSFPVFTQIRETTKC